MNGIVGIDLGTTNSLVAMVVSTEQKETLLDSLSKYAIIFP